MADFDLDLSGTPFEDSNNLQAIGTTWNANFNLASTSNLNVVLEVFPQSFDADAERGDGDADLRLYQDTDNNGEFNSSIDLLIGSSTLGGDSDESINLESVAAGNYVVEAYMVSGDNINLDLSLSTSDPSNLLPTEVEVGTLNDTQTFTDFVDSTDTADVYHFSVVDTAINFSLSLTDLSADADVRLIQDTNNNGIVDVDLDEVIASSTFGSTTSDEISAFLNLGENYFVQVYQHSGDTDYTLGLTA